MGTRKNALARTDSENELQYHKRLIYGKLVDKTLSDYDYTELAECVYGKKYAPDVARRLMYGSRYTLDLFDRFNSNCVTEDSADIERRIVELKKERQRFFDQRREYQKHVTKEGRLENLFDRLADAANNLGETVGGLFTDVVTCSNSIEDSGSTEAVLVFSDWHYGMTVRNIYNTYNTDVCKDRVRHVVDEAIIRLTLHNCSRLHIVVLGDMFHGAIHTGVRVAAEETACDQLMQVSEILAQAIDTLSKVVPDITVYMTYGNHGRTVQNKNDSIHRDNMERLIPWWIGERLRNNQRVHIAEDNGTEFLFITAAGHEFCASHGDLDSVKQSPRLLHTLMHKRLGRDIEYILLGDKHHREYFDELDVTAQLCGSLCGPDDYANNKRMYSAPSQLLLIVNENCGVDAEYKLRC